MKTQNSKIRVEDVQKIIKTRFKQLAEIVCEVAVGMRYFNKHKDENGKYYTLNK